MDRKTFEHEYWRHNYSEPETMDGICNAVEHATYLKSLFELDCIKVSSIFDFGLGHGVLFEEMVKAFRPYKIGAIEPSHYARDLFKRRKKSALLKNLKVGQEDLLSWCKKHLEPKKSYDLGVCTSVLQYLDDTQLKYIIPVLSKNVKYLYLTVPTDKELTKQRNELDFNDHYAIRRSRSKYYQILSPEFTFLSNRLLESKHFFDQSNTPFTEYLYRF